MWKLLYSWMNICMFLSFISCLLLTLVIVYCKQDVLSPMDRYSIFLLKINGHLQFDMYLTILIRSEDLQSEYETKPEGNIKINVVLDFGLL